MSFEINKEFFAQLINGKLKTPFKNYVLQLKINQLLLDYKNNFITLDKAVDELTSLYNKYKILFDKEVINFTSKKIERKTYTLQETIGFIEDGKILSIAADEQLLEQLPQGNWIAGTIPYFMDKDGGKLNKELLFVDDLTDFIDEYKIVKYTAETIKNVANDAYDNGFTILIIPAGSDTLAEYAINVPYFNKIYEKPIIGYIAGFDLNKMGIDTAKTVFGPDKSISDKGVAIHIKLPAKKIANIEIINLNSIDQNSVVIEVPNNSFTQGDCLIDGKPANLYDFVVQNNYTRPFVADYDGAVINRDIMTKDEKTKTVTFFSPLFKGIKYRLSNPIEDYYLKFTQMLEKVETSNVAYSTICVSYYGLANLEGRKLKMTGPFTFGEIGYHLLNQTLVYLKIIEP